MARKNMTNGPMTQLSRSDILKTFVSLKTLPIFPYRTLAKGGYIITISPIARGILVVPEENELIKVDEDGKK